MTAKDIYRYWPQVRQGLFQALDMVTDAQLDFCPREGLWSLGQVACHIAEAEDGWFRYVVTRELSSWPEFKTAAYPTVASIKDLLAEVHARTLAYLETLDEDTMVRPFDVPEMGTTTVRWVTWHVLEHEIHHRGEIFLMLGLLGMQAPDV